MAQSEAGADRVFAVALVRDDLGLVEGVRRRGLVCLLVWTRTASPRPTSIRPAGTACGAVAGVKCHRGGRYRSRAPSAAAQLRRVPTNAG